MEFNNSKQEEYNLFIEVLKDVEVQTLNIRLDGVDQKILISNQGSYAVYLGKFQTCIVEDNEACTFSFQPQNKFYEEIIHSYSHSLLDSFTEEISKESLYEALPKENTERLYTILKRLLALSKKAVIEQDASLKNWIVKEVREFISKEYSGTKNYIGNWWIYEIGIPRCLNEMIFLLYDIMDKEEICRMMAIENFYIPQAEYEYYRRNYPDIHRIQTDYANLSDTIYICLLRSILLQDEKEIQRLASLLPQILKLTESGNGFYLDGSFLYHTTVPYNASYGEVLLFSITKIIEIFHMLNIDIRQSMDVLYERIEQSYLPFLYHERALDCVRGRASSRRADGNYSYKRIMDSLHRLSKLYYRPGLLDKIYNEEEIFHYEPQAKAFNSMNRYIKRNQEYLIAISACSSYISNYESINNENILGSYQGNFVYDVYYNRAPEKNEVLKQNPLYRMGSTNILQLEEPNQIMENDITAGVSYKDVLNTCFHQKNEVEGYFSKFVLKNSLVAVGTHIQSKEEYISTLYVFEDTYSINKKTIETKEAKLIFKDKPQIEQVLETRSYHDLNDNEADVPIHFRQTRVYYKNPKEYAYQLYPRKMAVVDEYKLHIVDTAHIVEYLNMVLINCFTDAPVAFNDIRITGRGSYILVRNQDQIELYFASNPNQKIGIHILGYEEIQVEVKDRLEQKMTVRRRL